MGKASSVVRPLFGLKPTARRVGCVASVAALLLGCSSSSDNGTNNGGSDQSESGGAAGKPSASGGNATGSAGDQATGAGTSNATGGTSNGGAGNIITGRAGAQGRAGASGGGTADGSLGGPCTSDAQCGSGMVCATANGTLFGNGGPANGMCTKSCEPGGTECAALKAGAECFDFGTETAPQGYCLDACVQTEPDQLTDKCQGRPDFVCADLGDTSPLPFCVPHCRADAECGSGLFCDKSSLLGLCTKTKPTGDPVGTACTPGAMPPTCEGLCLRTSADGVSPVTGVCAELCSIGSECMYGSGSKPSPGGFCGGALSDTPSILDLGFCLPNCSCTSDCKFEGDLCRKWPDADADLAQLLGAPGVCYPTVAMSTELTCSQGGAGGAPAQSAGSGGGNP